MKVPPELEVDILSRLPVKSLLRFRCVSKEWFRLLTVDTNFINNMHLPRSLKTHSINPNPSLISLSECYVGGTHNSYLEDYKVAEEEGEGVVKPIYVDLPVCENKRSSHDYYYKCVGICNGLVCLTLYKFTPTSDTSVFRLFVWNPLTRHHTTLLPLSSLHHHFSLDYVIFGFGFHPPTNEYKVVRIQTNLHQSSPISVYTLGTKTWRTLGVVSYDFGFRNFPTTINGAPHWSVRKFRSSSYLIVFFDVKDEVLQEIPLPFPAPAPVPVDYHSVRISEFCGLLCVIVHSTLQMDIEMWVMKEHGVSSSWTRLFKIRQFETPDKSDLWDWSPLGISRNGEITLRSNCEHEEMKLLIYNPKTNSFKGPTKFGFVWGDVYTFAGSLISPEVINGGAREATL